MSRTHDMDFMYRGHHVQVSHEIVTETYLKGSDVVFTTVIDGRKTIVPGIWSAYKTASLEGVSLVIKAMLDGSG